MTVPTAKPVKIDSIRIYPKGWIAVACSIIFGGLSTVSLISGVGFAMGWMKPAVERPGTNPGIKALIASLCLMPVAAASIYRARMARLPILELFSEGVQVRVVGSMQPSGIPPLAVVRLALVVWSIASTRAFRSKLIRIPWSQLSPMTVKPGMTRKLILNRIHHTPTGSHVSNWMEFTDATFILNIDRVAAVVNQFIYEPSQRDLLNSWLPVAKPTVQPFGADGNLR